jgi:hypothetical protein
MVRYLDLVENRNAGKLFNVCRPPNYHVRHVPTFKNAKHPGYALFNNDIYFETHAGEKAL